MAKSQARSKQKSTGGKLKSFRSKRKRELGRHQTLTKLGRDRVKMVRTLGGARKRKTVSVRHANVFNPKTKKYQKVEIQSVVKNVSNRHYVRGQIMTKGAVVKTSLGNAVITNRPSQEGVVNAVLVESEVVKKETKKRKS
jgi:small subunit ribosomal protein S8e